MFCHYSIAVPSGVGLSAVLEFSIPDFQRIVARLLSEQVVTREGLLEGYSLEVSSYSEICHHNT